MVINGKRGICVYDSSLIFVTLVLRPSLDSRSPLSWPTGLYARSNRPQPLTSGAPGTDFSEPPCETGWRADHYEPSGGLSTNKSREAECVVPRFKCSLWGPQYSWSIEPLGVNTAAHSFVKEPSFSHILVCGCSCSKSEWTLSTNFTWSKLLVKSINILYEVAICLSAVSLLVFIFSHFEWGN